MLNSLSLKAKIVTLSVFLVLIAGLVGGIGFRSLHKVEAVYGEIADHILPSINSSNAMYVSFKEARIALRTLGLSGINREQSDKAILEAKEAVEAFDENLAEYEKKDLSPDEREQLKLVKSEWLSFKNLGAEIFELEKKSDYKSKVRLTEIFFVDCPKHADSVGKAFSDLLGYQMKQSKSYRAEASETAHFSNILSMSVLALGVVLGLLAAILFSNKISSVVLKLTEDLSDGANQVANASQQISSASEELSQATTEQAASLEETSSSVEELNSMVSSNNENAQKTADSSELSREKAESGKQVVQKMIHSMSDINESNDNIMNQINESNEKISEIVKVISEIGNKTKVINDIVFQTKLLSFNASVEAARAGEHGKGFAVVAEEVGNLAQMSGNAAKEISEMLEGSIEKVENIVNETKTKVESLVKTGKLKLEEGSAIAKECGDVLEEIVENVNNVSRMASEISAASKEQSQGLTEITKSMGQLDKVTQQNAATAEETASSSEELTAQAESLRGSVRELLIMVKGKLDSNDSYTASHSKKTNVVSLSTFKKQQAPLKTQHLGSNGSKKAVSNGSMPDYDDDRFEEI